MSFKPFKADFQTNGSNWCPNFGQSFVFYLNFGCKLWIEVLKVKNSRLPCDWNSNAAVCLKLGIKNFSNHQTNLVKLFQDSICFSIKIAVRSQKLCMRIMILIALQNFEYEIWIVWIYWLKWIDLIN